MTARGLLRWSAALVLLAPTCGCTHAPPADAEPAAISSAALPGSAEELSALLVTEVPSGLPPVPDADLDPPAGPKTLEDVAGYSADPAREREVLADYGYQRGWERFWRADAAQTTVFVDQFATAEGAAAYARDLAHNDAGYYGGALASNPLGLPDDCMVLTTDQAGERRGLAGPTAFAWCPQGVFSVGVAAVAPTEEAASAELHAVVADQLARLPG